MSLELKNSLRSAGFTFDYSELFTKNTKLNVLAWDAATNAVKVSDLKLTELIDGTGSGTGSTLNLEDYATLSTPQIITGSKTFADGNLVVDISSSVPKANAANDGINVLVYAPANGRVAPSNLPTSSLPTKPGLNIFTGTNTFADQKLIIGAPAASLATLATPNVALVVHGTADGTLRRSAIDVTSLAGVHTPNTFDENCISLGQPTPDDPQTDARQLVVYNTATGAIRKSALVAKDVVTTTASHTFTNANTFKENALLLATQTRGDDAVGKSGLGLVAFDTQTGIVRRSAIDPTTLALTNRTSKFETNTLQISQSIKDATNQKERNLVVWDTSLSNAGTVRLSAISSLDLMLANQDQLIVGKKTFADATMFLQKPASGVEDSREIGHNLVVFDTDSGQVRRSDIPRANIVLTSSANTFSSTNAFTGVNSFAGDTTFAENKLVLAGTSVDDASAINRHVVVYDTTSGALRKSALATASIATSADILKCAQINGDTVFTGQNSFANNTTFHNGRLYFQQNKQDEKDTPDLKVVAFNADGNIRQTNIPTTDLALRSDLNDLAVRSGPNTFNSANTFAFTTNFKDSTLILNQASDDTLDEPNRNFVVFNTDNNIVRRSAIKTSDFVTKKSIALDNDFLLAKCDKDNTFTGINEFNAGGIRISQSLNDDLTTPSRNLLVFDTTNGAVRRSGIATSDLITYTRLAAELSAWGEAHIPEQYDLSNYASKIGTNIFTGVSTFKENTLKLDTQQLGEDGPSATKCFVVFDSATGCLRRSALSTADAFVTPATLHDFAAGVKQSNVFEGSNTFKSSVILDDATSPSEVPTTTNRALLTYDTISGGVHKCTLSPDALATQTDLANAVAQMQAAVASSSQQQQSPSSSSTMLLSDNNTFSGTNAFTNEVSVTSLKLLTNSPPEPVNASNLRLVVYNADGYARKSWLSTMSFPTLAGNNIFTGCSAFDSNTLKLNVADTGDDAANTDGRRFVVFDAANGFVRRSAISTKDFAPASVMDELATLRATVAELSATVAALQQQLS